ncbi:MAG TPA: VWA domain-containing protein [Vicinamibacterales bacterium]
MWGGWVLGLGVGLAAYLAVPAQQPTFRAAALGVRVDVLVLDGRKPVGGLSAADFELLDNGVPQSVQLIDTRDIPLNVVLAFDTSASIEGKRRTDLIVAGAALLDRMHPADRVALTTFNHAVVPAAPLTSDVATVRQRLSRIAPSGRTAVMDGTYVALTATLAQAGRSLVVVCTDGADISSWLRPEDVVEAARRSNAVLYSVTTADAIRSPALDAVVGATGGEGLTVKASAELSAAFQRILSDFRSRYVLAYTPTGVAEGGFHRLDVRVKRRGLTVKARSGYVGAAQ